MQCNNVCVEDFYTQEKRFSLLIESAESFDDLDWKKLSKVIPFNLAKKYKTLVNWNIIRGRLLNNGEFDTLLKLFNEGFIKNIVGVPYYVIEDILEEIPDIMLKEVFKNSSNISYNIEKNIEFIEKHFDFMERVMGRQEFIELLTDLFLDRPYTFYYVCKPRFQDIFREILSRIRSKNEHEYFGYSDVRLYGLYGELPEEEFIEFFESLPSPLRKHFIKSSYADAFVLLANRKLLTLNEIKLFNPVKIFGLIGLKYYLKGK